MTVQATPAPTLETPAPVTYVGRSRIVTMYPGHNPLPVLEGEDGAGAGTGGVNPEGAPAEGADAPGAPDAPPADGKPAEPPSWRAAIADEDLRKHAERFNSPEDLVKGHLELRKKLSAAVVPPGEGASEEEVTAWRQKMGIPEAPDGYEFKAPDGVELSETDKAFQGTMAETFHKAGLTKDQAAALQGAFTEFTAKQLEAQKAADAEFVAQADAALKKEWGGDYDANRAYATKAFTALAGEDGDALKQMETKDGRFLLDNPLMLKVFAKIGREMGEDRIGPALTDADKGTVQEEITAMRQKRNEANARGDHAAAKTYDSKLLSLYAKLEGNGRIGPGAR